MRSCRRAGGGEDGKADPGLSRASASNSSQTHCMRRYFLTVRSILLSYREGGAHREEDVGHQLGEESWTQFHLPLGDPQGCPSPWAMGVNPAK